MKTLKNNFTTMLLLLAIVMTFTSCKKDKNTNSENGFDPTKYYITGEYVVSGTTTSSYVYGFLPLAKTYESAFGGSKSETNNYKYAEGILSIGNLSFNIVNESVESSSLPNTFKSHYLQKIPDVDAFAGKTFRGTVATNGIANGKSCLIKFTTTKKFTVSIDGFGQTGTGADYTLQNNGIATANTGNEGRLHLMSIANGNLFYSQYNAASNTHYYGLLTTE